MLPGDSTNFYPPVGGEAWPRARADWTVPRPAVGADLAHATECDHPWLKLLDQVPMRAGPRYAASYVVTVSVDQVEFRRPIHVGEPVTFLARSTT